MVCLLLNHSLSNQVCPGDISVAIQATRSQWDRGRGLGLHRAPTAEEGITTTYSLKVLFPNPSNRMFQQYLKSLFRKINPNKIT